MANWERTCAALEAGERLDAELALPLFDRDRFHEVGRFANAERERRHGNATWYNVNRHLNYSNVCVYRCRFCAYSAEREDPSAWGLSIDEMVDRARREVPDGVTELHIVGGAHPDHDLAFYERLLDELRRARPEVHLKAFSAVEIHYFAQREGLSVRDVLERLRAAGLASLPGGGAEIFADRVRRELCPDKATADEWLAVHREAHGMGMRSNATILYGHIESAEERIDHLLRLRDLQDETGGFQAIIPLKFNPDNTGLADLPRSGGILDLRMVAVCRLVLDNVDHVKAYWPAMTPKVAQTALAWGADDLDGTLVRERIYQDAGTKAPEGMDVEELRRLIEEAGREPQERDSLYRPVGQGK